MHVFVPSLLEILCWRDELIAGASFKEKLTLKLAKMIHFSTRQHGVANANGAKNDESIGFSHTFVILAYVIVCTRHNSRLWLADKCCKRSFYILSLVNYIKITINYTKRWVLHLSYELPARTNQKSIETSQIKCHFARKKNSTYCGKWVSIASLRKTRNGNGKLNIIF